MSTPRVTVLMNVRNGAPWLREALDSVLAQTFCDWEIVLWDDCSTDESAAIARSYNDSRIRYFLSPVDTPLGTARNQALQHVRGAWVAFLDQDDIWLPRKLEQQMALVDADTAATVGLIYGRTAEFFPNGRARDFDALHEFTSLPEGRILSELFQKSCFIVMSSAMIRHEALLETGPVPEDFQLISDFYFFVMVSRTWETRAVQNLVCRYRRHEYSLSRAHRRCIYLEALQLLEQWDGEIATADLQMASRLWNTALAMCELGEPGSFVSGVRRLMLRGSPAYFAARPFARIWRVLRSRCGTPRWALPVPDASTVVPRHLAAQYAETSSIDLSIIVVSWNVRDLLRDCLTSVESKLRLERDRWELIVIDNDSSDDSATMVAEQFPAVSLLRNKENTGFARANNQALSHCSGRYTLLLNPDVVLLDDAIDRMLQQMEHDPETGVIGCRLLNSDRSLQRWTAGAVPSLSNVAAHFLFLHNLLPAALLPPPLFMTSEPTADAAVGWVSGACMLLRRAALRDSIFDEQFFMYGEDLRLCESLAQAGWKVIYTPGAEVVHHGGSSIDQQTPEIQLSKVRNLRTIFAQSHRRLQTRCFDVVISVSFLLRYAAFHLAAITRPGRGYEAKAKKSRHFFADAIRSLLDRVSV